MLTRDSSTESDSGSIELKSGTDDQRGGYLALQRTYSLHNEDLCAKTLQAINQIKCFDIGTIQRDNSLHEVILGASDVILHFLDCSCIRAPEECCTVLFVFPHLAEADFLSVLFLHRRACRAIAAQSDGSTPSTTVVCWVDVILAKLAALILIVAGGLTRPASAQDSDFLRSRREEDYVHAATQLPESWQRVVDVIGSNTTSPAAARLATRLLFATLVMGPQMNAKRWGDPSILPLDVMSAVLRNADHKYLNGLSMATGLEYDVDERAHFAMLAVIFCTSQMVLSDDFPDKHRPQIKIQSLASLLNIVQIAFFGHGDTAACGLRTLPYEALNTAQAVLVRWGSLVPWSWSTWGDQRVANAECITDLTITWLYHLNSPFCTDAVSECLPTFVVQLGSMIADEESKFGTIIVVTNRLMGHMRESRKQAPIDIPACLAIVLRKVCSATVQLLHYNAERHNLPYELVIQSVCQSLQAIFCCLGDTPDDLNGAYQTPLSRCFANEESKVKDLIVENLSLIPPGVFISSFRTLREDDQLQIDTKVEEGITRSIEKIELVRNATLPDIASCFAVKCILCFLTLLWHSDLDNCDLSPSALLLISKAMSFLREGSDRKILPVLGNPLLTCASITDRPMVSGDRRIIEEVAFWDLAIRSESTNLSIASAFAYRIFVTGGQHLDPLSLAEAWNHLRDVLLVILTRRFAEGDEPLALLVCPGLCLALAVMIQATSPATEFIVSSPWTTSLCTELRSLVTAQPPSEEKYFFALRRQLQKVGKVLLDQLASELLHRSSTPTVSRNVEWRLVYNYASTGSHLVLVTEG